MTRTDPPNRITLLVARHAEVSRTTKPNGHCLIGGAQGNTHLRGFTLGKGLDSSVRREIAAKGAELAKKHPLVDAVYTGGLFRGIETAECLIEGYNLAGAKITTGNQLSPEQPQADVRITERDYGPVFSSVMHGIFDDDLFLTVAPARGWLDGISIDVLKNLFPEDCKRINSSDVLDYLKAIITPDGKGVKKIGALIAHSNLEAAGIESDQRIENRLFDFENSVLNVHVPGSTILLVTHRDTISVWLNKVSKDSSGRYTCETRAALQAWDAAYTEKKIGNYRALDFVGNFAIELSYGSRAAG
ncbi:Uncharacterised protein [Candidatus Gugararchaeum adminiculabundum]|nr:Uncharacterised protein [Candidatus Gugararchaeum adminiculabundum]